MTLKEKIDAYKESFKTKVPEEVRGIMQRATENLQNSPQMLKTVRVGSIAPDFSLKNYNDVEIGLGDLILRGPVVLVFYRGRW
jgi:hypothetical protein